MAIAIASGVTPAQGLYTAIVGGFLVSALGGSRFQIGGPAGAFIVLVAATVRAARHRRADPRHLPVRADARSRSASCGSAPSSSSFPIPVTVGFTAGIAVIIFASQLKELLGLDARRREPGPLLEKLPALWSARCRR